MNFHKLRPSKPDPAAQPLDEATCERVRACLAGDWSRRALASFGVNDKTLLAALAGAPVNPGTRAVIRESLATRAAEQATQTHQAAGGA